MSSLWVGPTLPTNSFICFFFFSLLLLNLEGNDDERVIKQLACKGAGEERPNKTQGQFCNIWTYKQIYVYLHQNFSFFPFTNQTNF